MEATRRVLAFDEVIKEATTRSFPAGVRGIGGIEHIFWRQGDPNSHTTAKRINTEAAARILKIPRFLNVS